MKLLTEEYRNQISQMDNWGENGWKWADAVLKLIDKHELKTALDYGCGQGTLKQKVMEEYYPNDWYKEYDPVKNKRLPVDSVDLITCTDVLEHVEPEYIDDVILHILSLTKKVCFIVISLKDTERILPNGKSAHLIIQNAGWWIEKITRLGRLHKESLINSIERLFSFRLDNKKQLILVLRKINEEELLDKT